MKRKFFLLLAIIVLAMSAAVSISAQEDEEMTTELAPADEHMKQFEWFIGEWEVASRLLMDAETDEWIEETLHTKHTYEMGGHIIFEHVQGNLGGAPYEAWSLRKYNATSSQWEQAYLDVQSTPILRWGGVFNEAGEYTGYAMRFVDENFNLTGDQGAREVFFNITPDHFSWRYETTSDGGATWTVAWTLEYTRVQ